MLFLKHSILFLLYSGLIYCMEKFDFKKYCLKCGAWCCKGETNVLKEKHIIQSKENGECVFLANNLCTNYSKRPFDCRDFPLDVMIINDTLTWVAWKNCPALKEINLEDFLNKTEKKLVKKYGKPQIKAQAISNKTMLPNKYKQKNMLVLREVRFK